MPTSHPSFTLLVRQKSKTNNSSTAQAQNNPSSHLLGPTPTFVSSWSDPTHPSNNGGLVSFLSHSNSGTSGRKKESHRRRRRRGSSNTPTPTPPSPPRRNGLLATALGGANGTGRRDGGGRPSLIGGVREMISGPGGRDQGLIKGIRKISMSSVSSPCPVLRWC
jgi:hypothetical protein